MRDLGLYIHVPFCTTDCSYCHFPRTSRHDAPLRDRYVDGVVAELDLRMRSCDLLHDGVRTVATIYIGGGTPSCLAPSAMERLLQGLARLAWAPGPEITVEANPETFSADLARAWKELGIDRVSLGVQSLDPDVLDLLGRACTPQRNREALGRACATFPRVSADWILGPALRWEKLRDELSWAVDLGVEHLSLYILEIHDGTRIAQQVADGRLRLPPSAETETLYLAAVEHLAELGLDQYEVSNFARPGGEARHNRRYWRRRPYLGLGPGAHGHWGRRRYANRAGVHDWLADVEAGRTPEAEVDRLDPRARRLERVILGLRTREGVPGEWLPSGILDIERGVAEGLWRLDGGRFALTPRGFLHIDTIEERVAADLR